MYAYEPEIGCEHLVATLHIVFAKGNESQQSEPVMILSADVRSAFDSLGVWALLAAMRYWCVPADLATAILSELCRIKVVAGTSGTVTEAFA